MALFMQNTGISPGPAGMSRSPLWPEIEAADLILAYDYRAILGLDAAVPADLAARATATGTGHERE